MPLRRIFWILPLIAWGCGSDVAEIDLADLTVNERLYVERYVVLERARAFALAEPTQGAALLDSLGVAWGDSADAEALHALPTDPSRVYLIQDLVRRVLLAESDSLVFAPRADRLSEPLPQPVTD